MALYDYECPECGCIQEQFANVNDESLRPCPKCVGLMHKIISASGANCSNEDADWIRSAAEVAGTENAEGREFKRNPTRSNLKAWMVVKNLRHMEPGERPARPEHPDVNKITEKLIRKYQERHRIEI